MKFINEEAKSIHGNVRLGSVFTTESGEWKLGGFEVLSSIADDEPLIYVGGIILSVYCSLMGYCTEIWRSSARF